VAATTIWSGASYIYTKDAVKILSQVELQAQQGKGIEGKPQGIDEHLKR
jgi:hypothetical protein